MFVEKKTSYSSWRCSGSFFKILYTMARFNIFTLFCKISRKIENEPLKKLESIGKEKLENLKNKLDTIEHLDQLDDELSKVYSKGISSISHIGTLTILFSKKLVHFF